MALNPAKGNMYSWVNFTHNHLGGECPHGCVYCYMDNPRFGRIPRYTGAIRLIVSELDVRYGSGKVIFLENCNDLFAEAVPTEYILAILLHCSLWPENVYVFQTKNPGRFLEFESFLPDNAILGTTIETNRDTSAISQAPWPLERMLAMAKIKTRKFVTCEPILDFDVDILTRWITRIHPEFVNIGADSKGHNLPEPTMEKTQGLINRLTAQGIEIREKHNLARLKR